MKSKKPILWGMFAIMFSIWIIDVITTINLIFVRKGFWEVSSVPAWLFTFGVPGLIGWILFGTLALFLLCLFFDLSFNLILNHPSIKEGKKKRIFEWIIDFLILLIIFLFLKSEIGAIVNNISLMGGI